jgi:hypothetical protein
MLNFSVAKDLRLPTLKITQLNSGVWGCRYSAPILPRKADAFPRKRVRIIV